MTRLPYHISLHQCRLLLTLLLLLTCCLLIVINGNQTTQAQSNQLHTKSSLTSPLKLKPSPKPEPPSKPIPHPTLPPFVGRSLSLGTLHMLSATTGWGLSDDGQQILHTTHGPEHWHDVSPHLHSSPYHFSSPDFLDPQIAWLALQNADQTFSILHTSDGGQNWQSSPIGSGVQVVQISFIDPQTGWTLFGTSTDLNQEAVQVLHSSNAGATWVTVSYTDTTTGNRPSWLPLSGDKTGLSFVNSTTGWVTGTSTNSRSPLYLYVTHDGGHFWSVQDLPLPPFSPNVLPYPPTFFNDHDGYLPVTIQAPNAITLYVFITHDSGSTWLPTTPTAPVTPSVTFSDLNHGWTFDQNNQLLVTNDGAQTWKLLAPQAPITFQNPGKLDFISATTGWLLYYDNTTYRLLETQDGGQTWQNLDPSVS